MTRAQRIAVIAAAAIVAIVAALLVAPEFVDWNGFRGDVAATLEERLGRPVAIDGGMDLSLLPAPHLVAERVRVGNVPGAADADFATVERLELNVRTGALLGGRFEVSSLTLIRPSFNLQRFPDGRTNWRFVPASEDTSHGPIIARPAVILPAGANATLDQVDLRGARIAFRSPRAGLVAVDGVNASATAESADGPFQFRGDTRFGDLAVAVQGSLGRLSASETPADLTVALGDGAVRLSLGGVLEGRDAATAFTGKLTVKAAHTDRLAALLGASTQANGPVEIRANVAATLNEFAAQDMTVDLPGASLTGFAALNMEGDPQLDLKLATPRLDLGPWLALAAPARGRNGAALAPSPTQGANPATPSPAIAPKLGFAPPAWLGVSLDLNAESVALPNTLLRAARLNAQLANGELTINQVGVTLPGGTQINLFGFIDTVDGKPSFDGSFETGTDDLRGLLRWLAIDASGVPADRLGAARFTGHIVAAPDRIKLDGAEARVDGARVTTAVDLRLPAQSAGRPALGLSFAIDTLNADAYRPHANAKAASASTPLSPTAALSAGPPAAKPTLAGPTARWLAGFDANFKGRIEHLVAGGQTATGVDLDGALDNGALTLRTLAFADFTGAQIAATGRIDNLGGEPRFDELQVTAKSADPHRLLTEAGLISADDTGQGGLGPLDFAIRLDGDVAHLAVKSQASLGALAASIDGAVDDPLARPRLDASVGLSDASLGAALHLLGQDYAGRAAGQPIAMTFHVAGDMAKLQFSEARATLGPVAASGTATLSLAGRPRLDAAIAAGEMPLDLLIGGAGAAAPAPVRLETPAPAKQAPAPGEPTPPKAAPREPVLVGGIPERFSHAPIDLASLLAWDGTLKLDATTLTWGGFRLDQAALVATLADGKATIDRLTGKLWGGDFAVSAALDSSAGAVSAEAKVTGAQLDQAALEVADLGLAGGTLDAEADLTTTGQSLAELMGHLSGTGSIAGHDGTLKGFDLKAASERLRNPSAASLMTLVQAGARGGQTKFTALTGTIKANGGIFTTDDLTLTAEGGTLNGAAAVNLPAYAVDARAALHLADAPSAPPLVMRLAGPLDAPRRVIDINPLQTWLAQRGMKAPKLDAGGN